MKKALNFIILILVISINTTLNSQESFEFNFKDFENNRLRDIKIYNNYIYITGYAYINNKDWDNYIIKYDMQGNQIFNKVFYHDYQDAVVKMEIKDNLIYILADWQPNSSSNDDSILNIFDLNGNLINNIAFGSAQDDMIADVLLDDENIYLSGSDVSTNYLMKLDKSNLQKKFIKQTNGLAPYRSEGLLKYNEKLYTCGYNVYQQTEFIVQRFDLNGNNEITKKLNVGSKVILMDGYFINDNYYVFGLNYANNFNTMFAFKLDSELNILESKKITNGIFNSFLKEYNSNFYFTYNLNNKTYFVKLNKDLDIELENEMQIATNLVDIQDDYFIFFKNSGNDSKIIFDQSNCFIYEENNNLISTNITANEAIINNVKMIDERSFYNLDYIFMDGNLPMNKVICSTPCGDGSEFDSKVSSLDKFELNGAKLTEIDSYLMTDEKDYFSHGALSHIEPVYVSAAFNSEFAFKIDKGYNDFIDGSLPGADGFSLIFHTDNQHLNFKSDQYGGGMGFHNRKNAVALEIDLYNNDEYNDPDGNHIAFQVPKDGILEAIHSDENTLGINSNIPIMKADGKETYYCKLEYKDNILKVWLDKSQDYGIPALEINNFKFSDYLSLIEHSKVYVTLAAVTGTSYQKQEVIFWDWCSYYDPISSVEDNTKKDIISIYPNPSSEMIYIDGINSQTEIELFDLTGRKIISQNYNNGINISELNRGIYILNIQNQNYKIIKE